MSTPVNSVFGPYGAGPRTLEARPEDNRDEYEVNVSVTTRARSIGEAVQSVETAIRKGTDAEVNNVNAYRRPSFLGPLAGSTENKG